MFIAFWFNFLGKQEVIFKIDITVSGCVLLDNTNIKK